jgi:hypothetical protein
VTFVPGRLLPTGTSAGSGLTAVAVGFSTRLLAGRWGQAAEGRPPCETVRPALVPLLNVLVGFRLAELQRLQLKSLVLRTLRLAEGQPRFRGPGKAALLRTFTRLTAQLAVSNQSPPFTEWPSRVARTGSQFGLPQTSISIPSTLPMADIKAPLTALTPFKLDFVLTLSHTSTSGNGTSGPNFPKTKEWRNLSSPMQPRMRSNSEERLAHCTSRASSRTRQRR